MRYFKKMTADRLYLSPMNPEDVDLYAKWMNDSSVTDGLGRTSFVVTLPIEQTYIEDATKSGQNFAIVLKENDQLIGNASLFALNHIHRTCEIGIFIGDETQRGKGLGVEAMDLLLAYGFNVLNINNIMLRVFSFNERAIKAYEKVGFKALGRRTQAHFLNGKYHDEIYMEILKENYTCKYFTE